MIPARSSSARRSGLCRPALNRLCALALLFVAGVGQADGRTYLEVSPADREDLDALFTTLESTLDDGLPTGDPVIVILHGSEAGAFTRRGYPENRMLVDRAARLDAYRLIDVRICETWMTENRIDATEIPAFIDTVPYAPEEIERLEAEGYVPYRGLDI